MGNKISKILLVAIVIIFSNKNLFCNENTNPLEYLSVNVGFGYAFYDIESLKSSFNSSVNYLKFPAKVTDNYPNIPFPNVAVCLDFENFSCGLFLNYISTGARISYADFSGSYTYDSKLLCTTFGVIMTKITTIGDNYDIGVNVKTAINLVNHESIQNFDVSGIKESNSNIEKYNVFYFEIGGRFFYYYSMFKAGLEAGYGLELANKSNVSFSGPRISLLVGLRLGV